MEKTLAGVAAYLSEHGPKSLVDLYGDVPLLCLRPPEGSVPDAGGGTQRFKLPNEKDETSPGTLVSPWAATAQRDTVVYPLNESDRNPFAGVIAIGRRMNNDIVLPSAEVSKDHAMVKRTRDGWALRDGGSRNGTYLNFQRLASKIDFPLTSGDQIRFADIQGMFLHLDQLRTLLSLIR